MATAKLYNMARMTTATTGTGTITLGSAVAGFISFATAGVTDGDVVTYAIEDGSSREIGRGTYTAAGTTLTRTVLKSTNAGSAISLSGTAQVFITNAAEDHIAGPSVSVDSEIVLFSGTGGATLKRASTTGLLKAASGVLSAASAGTDYVAPSGALGTPSSGTLTNCSGLPVSGVTASTVTALGVGSIELGHASDTTLSRSSAGVLAVEGVTVPLNSTSSVHTASTIELGHATDTTLSRSSAGVLAVEGVTVALNSTSSVHTASTIELGAATDTTLSRSAAGILAVEGVDQMRVAGNQTVTGGFSLTPYNGGTVSSGTFTPTPANGNYQYYTNNGAHSLAVPASDCAIDVLVTNGASAGAITISGSYTAPSGGGGDTYATTNANKYVLSIRRINGVSTYLWKALQ